MTVLMTSDTYPLQPARLDLPSVIGCALARPSLSPAKRVLYERIRSRMSDGQRGRCDAAYIEAIKVQS